MKYIISLVGIFLGSALIAFAVTNGSLVWSHTINDPKEYGDPLSYGYKAELAPTQVNLYKYSDADANCYIVVNLDRYRIDVVSQISCVKK